MLAQDCERSCKQSLWGASGPKPAVLYDVQYLWRSSEAEQPSSRPMLQALNAADQYVCESFMRLQGAKEKLGLLAQHLCMQMSFNSHKVLESFKERGDCTDYALYIMTTPNPAHTDPVRFFALQCLGKTVSKEWAKLSSEQKLRYR
eukprot:5539-Heterococcus_DN1.PRE.2